jgi:hypothetical protein
MKIKAVSVLTSLLFVLSITLAGSTAFAGDIPVPHGVLTSQIDYFFVGHLGQFDDEGRLLVWEGSIEGDFTGEMKWWFVGPPPASGGTYEGGEVVFYAARWEIWDGESLLLAGESAGKTVFPVGADGMWDGHGIVTEARGRFNPLKGRKTNETGPVIAGTNPPVTFFGTGMFVIY